MKRRIIVTVVFCVLIPAFLFSKQSLYDGNSYEYTMTSIICKLAGVVGPSSALPVTDAELLIALDRVNEDLLPPDYQGLYQTLHSKFEPIDEFVFKPIVSVNPQLNLMKDYETRGRNDFFLKYKDDKPFIDFGGRVNFGNSFFIEGTFPSMNVSAKDNTPLTSFDFYVNHRNGKWNFYGSDEAKQAYGHPFLARGAAGNKWFNLVTGRSQLSYGSGYTGNLHVGDNYLFQEMLELTLCSNYFTYSLSLTHFDTETGIEEVQRTRFGGMHQLRAIHRLDGNLFGKLRCVVDLGITYFTDNSFDFRWLNPLMVVHNYFNFSENRHITLGDEANNTFSIELQVPITKGLTLNAQLLIDQYQGAGEDKNSVPDAYGLLLNMSYVLPIKQSYFEFWAEGVYTSPFVYLNEKYDDEAHTKPNYNYDYIQGYGFLSSENQELTYSGYGHGPDCILVAVGAKYRNFKHKITSDTYFQIKLKGEKDLTNPTFSGFMPSANISPTGIVEKTFTINNYTSWQCHKHIMLYGGMNLDYVINYKHQSVNKLEPQAYLGVSFFW